MVEVGESATCDEVRGRWAYSELRSSRFRANYSQVPEELQRKADCQKDEDLSDDDRLLLSRFEVPWRSRLLVLLQAHAEYKCESWKKDRICGCYVVEALDPQRIRKQQVPFLTFLASLRFRHADGSFEETDPRYAADAVDPTAQLVQHQPICVVPGAYGPLILDGTCRTILFVRSENLFDEILVWVPVQKIGLQNNI